jgi:hypothetical protein
MTDAKQVGQHYSDVIHTKGPEDGKKIVGYKNTKPDCGCSSSYVAIRGKSGNILKDKKIFTDYFCVAL